MSDITAKIKLDYSGFEGAMRKVDSLLVGAQRRAVGLQAGFSGIIGVMGSLAVIGAQLKGALDLGGTMEDMKASTGATAGELLIFRQACANTGVGAEGAGRMIARLQKAMGGVNEDGQSTSDVFSKLGLNISALNGMDMTGQMQALGAAFFRIEDPAMRTKMAMDLFGKSGFEMLAVLRDSSAFSVAAQQVGGLAGTMDAASGKFDSLSDAIGAVGLKSEQFFAAMANAMFDGTSAAEALNRVDLTGWGETAGAAMRAIGSAAGVAKDAMAALIPLLAGYGASLMAAKLGTLNLAASIGGPMVASMRSVVSAVATMRMGIITGYGAMTTMASVGRVACGTLALSFNAVKTAVNGMLVSTGIGIFVVAVTAAIEMLMSAISKAKAEAAALAGTDKTNFKDQKRNATSTKNISSEDERAAVMDDINRQIEAQNDLLENSAELSGAQLDQAYGQRNVLQNQLLVAQGITAEAMAANAAEKEKTKSAAETRKEMEKQAEEQKKTADKLTQDRKGAVQDVKKFKEDQELSDAETPEAKRKILMARSGISDIGGIDAEIDRLNKLQQTGNSSTTEAEIARMKELMGISGAVKDIDRGTAKETRDKWQGEVNDKSRKVQELMQAPPPALKVWADSARAIGLGGNAATNDGGIQKIIADRQKETAGLVKEIRDIIKAGRGVSGSTELLFN